jgi:hypothetical protein
VVVADAAAELLVVMDCGVDGDEHCDFRGRVERGGKVVVIEGGEEGGLVEAGEGPRDW